MLSTIVDDNSPIATVDHYSAMDLRHIPLRTLYKRTCEKLQITSNEHVNKQLPSQCTDQDHLFVTTFDCSRTYLGGKGGQAIVPIVEACQRLLHLNLNGVALSTSVAKALAVVLRTHRGLREVNLSHNNLGTSVAQMLLRAIIDNRRINTLVLDDCLIAPAILKKIDTQLKKNLSVKESFADPPAPVPFDPEEEARKLRAAEREAELRLQEKAEAKRRAEAVPDWMAEALMQFTEATFRHRHHMLDFLCVFDVKRKPKKVASSSPSDDIAVVEIEKKNRLAATDFARALTILDVQCLAQNPSRCRDFADCFGAYDRAADEIDYRIIVQALRVHVELEGLGASDASSSSPASILKRDPTTNTTSTEVETEEQRQKEEHHDGDVEENLKDDEEDEASQAKAKQEVEEESLIKPKFTKDELSFQNFLDECYDARDSLLSSFETLDRDCHDEVTFLEAIVGVSAVVGRSKAETERFLLRVVHEQQQQEQQQNSSSSAPSPSQQEGTTTGSNDDVSPARTASSSSPSTAHTSVSRYGHPNEDSVMQSFRPVNRRLPHMFGYRKALKRFRIPSAVEERLLPERSDWSGVKRTELMALVVPKDL